MRVVLGSWAGPEVRCKRRPWGNIRATFEQVTLREEPKRIGEISANRRTRLRTCFFCSVVFVQASIQRIALLIDTVTETLAGVWAVAEFAPIRAFCFLIAGPDVE